MITDIGIQVNWNGRNKVTVFARGSWEGQLCGLCGDYNGNLEDDWVAGPSCPDDKGQVVSQNIIYTVVPTKSDSDVMFCLHSY